MKILSFIAVALAVTSTAAVAQTGQSGGVDPSTKAMTPKSDVSPATPAAPMPSQAQTGTTPPSTPAPSAPSMGVPSTSNPPSATGTQSPGALNPPTTTAAEAAARSKIEAAGYSSVKGLTMAPSGTWRGVGMRNKVEVAVSLDSAGNVVSQ